MEKELNDIFVGVLSKREQLLKHLEKSQLESFFNFKYDQNKSKVNNFYLFINALESYKRNCRRWEEIHNGSCCVVERVRDEYLMPKIKQFISDISNEN